jgi:hypothetical protein
VRRILLFCVLCAVSNYQDVWMSVLYYTWLALAREVVHSLVCVLSGHRFMMVCALCSARMSVHAWNQLTQQVRSSAFFVAICGGNDQNQQLSDLDIPRFLGYIRVINPGLCRGFQCTWAEEGAGGQTQGQQLAVFNRGHEYSKWWQFVSENMSLSRLSRTSLVWFCSCLMSFDSSSHVFFEIEYDMVMLGFCFIWNASQGWGFIRFHTMFLLVSGFRRFYCPRMLMDALGLYI